MLFFCFHIEIPKTVPAVILAAGIFFSCGNEIKEVQNIASSEIVPVRTTLDVVYWYTDSARIKNQLFAGKMESYENDSNYVLLSGGIKILFFNKNGEEEAVLTAINGTIYNESGIMEARDSVRFINNMGEKLLTEKLTWDQDSSLVYTTKPVTIERGDGVIYGKGLTSNENFTRYRILEPSGVIYIDEKETHE